MATRIRKLAREVGRSSEELLGVLHALGFSRYRSPEDMVSGVIEAKLRKGLREGVEPLPVVTEAVRKPTVSSIERAARAEGDLMAQLVPGVVRQGAPPPRDQGTPKRPQPPTSRTEPRRESPRADAEPARTPVTAVDEDVDVGLRALAVERAALESLRRTLASQQTVLDAERSAVDDARERQEARERSLARERTALDELARNLELERASMDAERAHGVATRAPRTQEDSVEALLDARGLRGADEYERAIEALAGGRHLRDLLWTLRVDEPAAFERLLRERLLLVDGELPASITRGAAVVTVAPARAEVPSASALAKRANQLSERLLLHGMRRLRVLGGQPRWQRYLADALDTRIEVRTAPAVGTRTADAAMDDVTWADGIVLWDVSVSPEAREIYDACRPKVMVVAASGIAAFFDATCDALDD